jgi:superfamily II DNA/RNA helicase
MALTFAQLGVPDSIVSNLARLGITNPFEIQTATVPDALTGRDVCGRAPTGSGKTLAFGIALVALADRAEPKRPKALVLAPTRELAEQITTEIRTFAGRVRITAVYGGVGYRPQYRALNQGVDILVACPGRLEDLISQNAVDLSAVNRVVLDEADRMADMGFMPAVRRLLERTSGERQVMLYSATLDGDVAQLTRDYLRDPVRHEVSEETPDITAASHVFWNVTRDNRNVVIAAAISAVWPAIVFCRTRRGSDRLEGQLEEAGIKATAIHGGRSQNQRSRALAAFAAGKVEALVASDIAARGIHVAGVALVVHYDPPEDAKMYVHRSGRTARAGQGGVVLSLVFPDQTRSTRRMQYELGLKGPLVSPNYVALRLLSPTPVRNSTLAKPAEDAAIDTSQPLYPDRARITTDGRFGNHDDRRGETLPYRTRQEQAAGPSLNGPKPRDRRSDGKRPATRPQYHSGPRTGSRDSKLNGKRPAAKPLHSSGLRKRGSKPSRDITASAEAGDGKRLIAKPQFSTGKPITGSKPLGRRTSAQVGRGGRPDGRSVTKKSSGRGGPSREARRLRRHPPPAP